MNDISFLSYLLFFLTLCIFVMTKAVSDRKQLSQHIYQESVVAGGDQLAEPALPLLFKSVMYKRVIPTFNPDNKVQFKYLSRILTL